MILACPSCGSKFKIDPSKLGAQGRTVRCANCRHTWHASPEPDDTAPEAQADAPDAGPEPRLGAPTEDTLTQRSRGPEPNQADAGTRRDGGVADFEDSLRASRFRAYEAPDDEHHGGGRTALFGWLLLALVVVGLAAGLYQFRGQVVAQMPQTARYYEMIGIEVARAGAGLELRDVTRTRRLVDGESLLVIEGRVVNVTDGAREVPPLQVTLFDAAGDRLVAWTFQVERRTLPAGAETAFSTRRDDPPDTAREFALTFAPPAE